MNMDGRGGSQGNLPSTSYPSTNHAVNRSSWKITQKKSVREIEHTVRDLVAKQTSAKRVREYLLNIIWNMDRERTTLQKTINSLAKAYSFQTNLLAMKEEPEYYTIDAGESLQEDAAPGAPQKMEWSEGTRKAPTVGTRLEGPWCGSQPVFYPYPPNSQQFAYMQVRPRYMLQNRMASQNWVAPQQHQQQQQWQQEQQQEQHQENLQQEEQQKQLQQVERQKQEQRQKHEQRQKQEQRLKQREQEQRQKKHEQEQRQDQEEQRQQDQEQLPVQN